MTIKDIVQKGRERFRREFINLMTIVIPVKPRGEENGNHKLMERTLEVESHIDSRLIEVLEGVKEQVKKERCTVPKDPFPKKPNDLAKLTIKEIDECLKYAGRVNYNKSIDDVLSLITSVIDEIKK